MSAKIDVLHDLISTATNLKGDKLTNLMNDLKNRCDIYEEHTKSESIDRALRSAKWTADWSKALEKLVLLAERRPKDVIGEPIDLTKLRYQAALAKVDAGLHQDKELRDYRRLERRRKIRGQNNRKISRRSRGSNLSCRNWLGRQAASILSRHCPKFKPKELRSCVAAIFDIVGATYPDPVDRPVDFDTILSPPSKDDIEAAKEREAREKRLIAADDV